MDWDTLPKARDTMDCISDPLVIKGGESLILFALVLDPNLWFLVFMSEFWFCFQPVDCCFYSFPFLLIWSLLLSPAFTFIRFTAYFSSCDLVPPFPWRVHSSG